MENARWGIGCGCHDHITDRPNCWYSGRVLLWRQPQAVVGYLKTISFGRDPSFSTIIEAPSSMSFRRNISVPKARLITSWYEALLRRSDIQSKVSTASGDRRKVKRFSFTSNSLSSVFPWFSGAETAGSGTSCSMTSLSVAVAPSITVSSLSSLHRKTVDLLKSSLPKQSVKLSRGVRLAPRWCNAVNFAKMMGIVGHCRLFMVVDVL